MDLQERVKIYFSALSKILKNFMYAAILITGGYRGGYLKSTEIYLPSNNTSCSLPELLEGRGWHTQTGPWACGSDGSTTILKTCDKWSQGSWTRQSLQLRKSRKAHVSWFTASGLGMQGKQFFEFSLPCII